LSDSLIYTGESPITIYHPYGWYMDVFPLDRNEIKIYNPFTIQSASNWMARR
jgi:hypothetical protein